MVRAAGDRENKPSGSCLGAGVADAAIIGVRTVDFGERLTLSPALASAWMSLSSAADDFRRHYRGRGYIEQAPAHLVSRVDPSVRFIGSTISVLKSFIRTRSAPEPGVFLIQPALRTRNLEKLLDENAMPTSPSFFLHLGTLSPASFLEQAAIDGWMFFLDQCAGQSSRAVMRVSSQHQDLLTIARNLPGPAVEIDGEPQDHYRHQFGMVGISGRNLNYGICQSDGQINNVGNLVIMENDEGAVGIEVVIGLNHLVAGLFNLGHPIMASPAAAAVSISSLSEIKFADALVASSVLANMGLRPVGRGRGRTLRGYLQALAALRRSCGISFEDLERAVTYLLTGPESKIIALAIRRYVEVYDNYIASGAKYSDSAIPSSFAVLACGDQSLVLGPA